jgi:hypothetical protein
MYKWLESTLHCLYCSIEGPYVCFEAETCFYVDLVLVVE